MSAKKNNRLLLVIFLALAAIFVITRFTRVRNADQTLRGNITEIDTSLVTTMLLYPQAEQGNEILFLRNGSGWTVSNGGITAAADVRSVTGTLTALQNMETEQLVARSPESWGEYQVTDSLGTRIILKKGKKSMLDLLVGRFQYQPPPQGSNNIYGQNQISGKTYIRFSGEDEVFAVDGFLALSINQPYQRWRNQAITRISKSQLSRIVFDYPADSGYVAEKSEAGWLVAGIAADSASMDSYLNRILSKSHSDFADDFKSSEDPDYRISFEGDNMQTIQVSVYSEGEDNLVLHSSINPDTWFRIDQDLFTDLFPGYNALLEKTTDP